MPHFIRNLLLSLFVVLAVAGCKGEAGKHIDLSADDAFDKLLSGDLPRTIKSKQYSEMGEHEQVEYDYDGKTITWRRVWKDREYYRYQVRVTGSDENSSRVLVEFFPGESLSKLPKLSQKITYGAVAERIYSFLQSRPFDGANVNRYSMAYVMVNPVETHQEIAAETQKAIDAARKAGIAVPD